MDGRRLSKKKFEILNELLRTAEQEVVDLKNQ